MGFAPDILVSSPDALDLGLVVDVKLQERSLEEAAQQLRRYMFGMRCPVGMLVTPSRILLFRDTYTSYDEASIEQVGEYATAGLFDDALAGYPAEVNATLRGFRFEDAVQTWLERLAADADLSDLPPDLQDALQEHVLPALAQGEVRAAGPRTRR